jgi:hypothetical protein
MGQMYQAGHTMGHIAARYGLSVQKVTHLVHHVYRGE